MPLVDHYQGSPDQLFGHTTYSQHGEDLMILNLFTLLGNDRPSYLDLGAHHPTTLSNTKLLYLRGSRGVNIEANPNLVASFKHERPEDITVNIGVGIVPGIMHFYMYDEWSGRNTFSEEEVARFSPSFRVPNQIMRLPVKTLTEIIKLYCGDTYPDFLNIDVEGFDYDVLDGANFSKSHPTVICVETRKDQTSRMTRMLYHKGYIPICRMGENIICIHNTVASEVWK